MKPPRIFEVGGILLLFIFFSAQIFAQKPIVVTPKPKPTPKHKPMPDPLDAPEIAMWNDDVPFEKSIEVDDSLNLSLCVSEGNIKINGWERGELRVFINRGSKAGFKVHNKNSKGKPSRVTILGYDPTKPKGSDESQCLSGEEIELDVPVGTNLSNFSGTEGGVSVSIQLVSKAIVKVNEGNIQLRGIKEKVFAKTFEGDISVEDSKGNIDLDTTSGSILAFNVAPIEDGDGLRVKTNNGSIVVQSGKHSIIEATSITGLIKFNGAIKSDGQYNFRNTNGQILLEIPKESSCMVEVLSQKGKFSFDKEIPLKILTEEDNPRVRRLTAQIGGGAATVNLESQSGRISIKKIN